MASEVRLAGDDSQTRLVLDLSQKIDVRAFTLANPYRVVIDMPQVTFQLPPKTGEAGRGLIKAFRFGLVMQGGSRIVIDLARPARVDKAFVLEAANDQPARLVLDLAAVDREAFLRTIALESRPPERKPPPPADRQGRRRSAPGGGDRSRPWRHRQRHQGGERRDGEDHRPRVLADAARQDREDRQVPRVHDPHRGHIRARWPIASSSPAATRRRCSSRFMPTRCARREGDAQGATVYTLSERASDARAARLAEAENQADVIAGLDLAAQEPRTWPAS